MSTRFQTPTISPSDWRHLFQTPRLVKYLNVDYQMMERASFNFAFFLLLLMITSSLPLPTVGCSVDEDCNSTCLRKGYYCANGKCVCWNPTQLRANYKDDTNCTKCCKSLGQCTGKGTCVCPPTPAEK